MNWNDSSKLYLDERNYSLKLLELYNIYPLSVNTLFHALTLRGLYYLI